MKITLHQPFTLTDRFVRRLYRMVRTFVCCLLVVISAIFTPLSGQSAALAPQPSATRVSLLIVLRGIETKHKVFVFFESRIVEEKYLDMPPAAADAETALAEALRPFPLTFSKINADTYIIREQPVSPAISSPAADLPGYSTVKTKAAEPGNPTAPPALVLVTGRVVIKPDGTPLPGASVLTKGSTHSTITAADGSYALRVPQSGTTLVFSSVGFEKLEHVLGAQTVLNVALHPATQALREVVVVGYGTQARRDVTGAVGSLGEEQLRAGAPTTLDQALQGRVSGVSVLQGNASPGGAVYVRIRGAGSTGNNAPLYVIDGLPVFADLPISQSWGASDTQNPLLTLSPADIESIDVLKDASATAIYGARAANGVVVVTTRRGRPGPSQLTFDSYYGLQQPTRLPSMLTAPQYIALSNEVRGELGRPPFAEYSDPYQWGNGVDWLGALLRPAAVQSHSLSVRGGSKETQFALTGTYFRQAGVVIGSGLSRYSFRLNLDHQVSKRIRVGGNLSLARSVGKVLQTNDVFNGMILQALRALPTRTLYAPDGSFSGSDNAEVFGQGNPLGKASVVDNQLTASRFTGNAYVEYIPAPFLTLRSQVGVDMTYGYSQRYFPKYDFGATDLNRTVLNSVWNTQSLNWLSEQTLTYHRLLGKKHSLTALAGFTAQKNTDTGDFLYSEGQPDNRIRLLGAGTLSYIKDTRTAVGLVSAVGRLNYDFSRRYLATLTVRTDGSSRFGPRHRFGVFPAASLGWRLSEEPFLSLPDAVQELKLRVSHGLSGNQTLPDFLYLSTVSADTYTWGNTAAIGMAPGQFANADLKWETAAQTDVGLDAELWRGRFTATVDWYVKNTRDLLVQQSVPATSGFSQSSYVNLGRIRNQGWELALTARPLSGALQWESTLTLSHNRNRVLALARDVGGLKNQIFANALFSRPPVSVTQAGSPIGSFYGLVMDGIFQDAEEISISAQRDVPGIAPGDVRFLDLDQNGRIDENDRTVIGDPNPRLVFGSAHAFAWKGLKLDVFLQGVKGREVFNFARLFTESLDGRTNNTTVALGRWHGPGTSQTVPRATTVMYAHNAQPSSRYVEDGSYLRVRTVTLAWNLPQSWRTLLHLQVARLYVSGQNLFTFTRYSGFDPEVNSNAQAGDLSQGIDYISYPSARVLMAGAQVTF